LWKVTSSSGVDCREPLSSNAVSALFDFNRQQSTSCPQSPWLQRTKAVPMWKNTNKSSSNSPIGDHSLLPDGIQPGRNCPAVCGWTWIDFYARVFFRKHPRLPAPCFCSIAAAYSAALQSYSTGSNPIQCWVQCFRCLPPRSPLPSQPSLQEPRRALWSPPIESPPTLHRPVPPLGIVILPLLASYCFCLVIASARRGFAFQSGIL